MAVSAPGAPYTREAPPAPTLVVPFSALRRLFLRLALYALAIGIPAVIVTYQVSSRQPRVYRAEATLMAPVKAPAPPEVAFLTQPLPSESSPIMPTAYGPALRSRPVLEDAWLDLNPDAEGPPSSADLAELSDNISFHVDDRRNSNFILVSATGSTAIEAQVRANAMSEALVTWDDARARAEATKVVGALESLIEVLEDQVVSLQMSGSRANLPQIAGVTVLAATLRQDIAGARASAIATRGSLELLSPAPVSMQIEPSPLVDSATVFGLVAIGVLAVLLVLEGTNNRLRGASAIGNVAGLPVLADLSRVPGWAPATGRSYREMTFLKAHVDKALPDGGGQVLVAGLRDDGAAGRVAVALDRMYEGGPTTTRVVAGPPLLSSGDAVERAALAGAVIVVTDAQDTDRTDLQRAVSWLERAPANVLGLVTVRGEGGPGKRRRP